jgi:peptidoglycan/LPS O-acetylase OafA/YrhL
MFYLLAPLLVRRPLRMVVAAAACGALAYAAIAPGEHEGLAAIATNLSASLQYLPFFLFGSSLCHLFVIRRGSTLVSGVAAAVALCAMTWTGTGRIGASMVYVVALAIAIPLLFKLVKSRVDDFFGELSYPLYITHFLVLQACRQHVPSDAYPFVVTAVILGVAVAATFAVERPVEQFRHALGRRLTHVRIDHPAIVR